MAKIKVGAIHPVFPGYRLQPTAYRPPFTLPLTLLLFSVIVLVNVVGCGRKGEPLPPEKQPQSLSQSHTARMVIIS